MQTELAHRLSNERPRNHIDVRHRLDKDGKRYGKVIDFAQSELRVSELLDDLCDTMSNYHLSSHDRDEGESEQRWILSSEVPPDQQPNVHLIKEQQRVLKNICSDIISSCEDELSKGLRNGTVTADSVENFLCQEVSGFCKPDGSKLDREAEL